MSKINNENRNIQKKKLNKNSLNINQYKSPNRAENISPKIKIITKNDINIISPGRDIKFIETNNNNNNYIQETEDKDNKLFKGFLQKLNKIGEFGFNEKNTYMFPLINKDMNDLNENNIICEQIQKTENNKNSKMIKDINNRINDNNIINIKNTNKNINQRNISPNKQPLFNNDQYDSKYSLKINKIKDDYIDFLQKEFEDNAKKSAKLDLNNKELLKKCEDLLHDNKLLSSTLNDRTTKLNNIIQENLTVKSQLDKALITNQKNEQKIEFYEEQFNLYKTSDENNKKIIKELNEQINQLNNNLEEIQKINEDNIIETEEKYNNKIKIEIEKNKKEIEDFFINRNREENINKEQRIQEMILYIKNLEEKIEELNTELTNKENMLEMILKENEKLTEENNLFKNEIEQYTNQISELNNIIKHKDNIISNLKSENLNNDKLLNKSSSCSMIKLNETNEYFNENISKLISDNEENKLKIELLNDKIKNIDKMEKKYTEIINNKNRSFILTDKFSYKNMNINNISPKKSNNHFNYNNFKELQNSSYNLFNNSNYRSFISPKKLQLQEIEEINNSNIPEKNKNRNKFNNMIIITSQNKEKKIELNQKPEKSPPPILSRYYYNNNNYNNNEQKEKMHGKEIKTEKEEIKDSIREINRKKNYTYKPKNNNNIYINNNQLENKSINIINTENENEIIKEQYYLYGIDRDDLLHVFDINSRNWVNLRKIEEINDLSNTFKKDYQYEGTILYNTLSGLYILTGEKTDVLYFYNSLTDSISKICKFNNSHDNGSFLFDNVNKCLYVFGGKKTKSCEYYSFIDKNIYKLPDLNIDRANASYIISNNKIFSFFGFSYNKNTYCNNIEYLDFTKKDKWNELKNIKLLKSDIYFDIESVSTLYYKKNPNLILIYCGIQGDDEDFVTEYYLVYDSINNTMDKINKWNLQQYKYINKKWKNYSLKKTDQKGFHFAKNSKFLMLPKDNDYEGYNNEDNIEVLIDYKNNVHYILQEKQKIDIYRNEL